MSPEIDTPGNNRFALLASGANFSCEVLQALQRLHHPPGLLVLPEYPPAHPVSKPVNDLIAASPNRRILALGEGIETAYAPVGKQAELSRLIRQGTFDFLLVACWTYLIGDALIKSPRKAALNLHPSLLPEFRGPNPIEQQLAQQTHRFGVTLHLLNETFDQGDIVAQAELTDIGRSPDSLHLEHRCALLGAELFIDAMKEHQRGWNPVPQRA
ncbi:MAG: formyltransferase family protein [Gammaproteobacteria bacterium]|nr:formyltransferase family protein [Gammaproteobacteria bacterium]MDH3858640.1 formyltransferase family protein [Gammaproteobacteria bacterium]